jgi:ATP-binding cassette subfamily C (CFTR/MRP) protein 1
VGCYNVIRADSVTAMMVQQFAQNEQNMNAVERVLVYTALPPEGDTQTLNDPPASWPEKDEIKFTDVELAYRDGLSFVLKGITFEVTLAHWEKKWDLKRL